MRNASFLIHDPSGELYKTTGKWLAHRGYTLFVLNYGQASQSCGYNPMARVHDESGALRLASSLITATYGPGSGSVVFWNNQAELLIAWFIITLLPCHPQHRTLWHVLDLIRQDPEIVKNQIELSGNQDILNKYESFLRQTEKIQSGILATASAALKIFDDPGVRKVTSYDSINFDQIRKTKTAIFIQSNIIHGRYLSPITSVFIDQLFTSFFSRLPDEQDRDFFCLIDEAATFRAPWSMILANCRKYRIGCLLAYQDLSQIIEQYGRHEAQTIASNCFAKLYFGNPSLQTARELSEQIGNIEFSDTRGQRHIRTLITPQEIRELPQDQALLLAGNYPPIKASMKPYFKRRRLRKRVGTPPLIFPH